MILSQGLLISLAFTLFVGVLLFFYIKQRTNAVEQKINTLIQFIQNETTKAQQLQQHTTSEMNVYPANEPSSETGSEMIDVSDDDESDSESDSATDSSSDNESDSDLDEDNIRTLTLVPNLIPIELDVFEPSNDVLQDDDTMKVVSLVPDTIHLTSNDDNESEEENIDELDDITMSESDTEHNDLHVQNISTPHLDMDVQLNYKKMLVNELRDLVTTKGLAENTKKLKKQELVELLETRL